MKSKVWISFDKCDLIFPFSSLPIFDVLLLTLYYLHYTSKMKTKSTLESTWNTATEIQPFKKCIYVIKFQNKSAVFDKDQKKFKKTVA